MWPNVTLIYESDSDSGTSRPLTNSAPLWDIYRQGSCCCSPLLPFATKITKWLQIYVSGEKSIFANNASKDVVVQNLLTGIYENMYPELCGISNIGQTVSKITYFYSGSKRVKIDNQSRVNYVDLLCIGVKG